MLLRKLAVITGVGGLVAFGAIGPAASGAQAPPEDITEGYRLEGTSTYTVDPAGRAIHVTVDFTVTNETPDEYSSTYLSQSYFDSVGIPVLSEAANLAATSGAGRSLSVRLEPVEAGSPVSFAVVDLAPNVFFRQSQSVHLTFDLPDQPARSPGFTRVNAAYAAVLPFAVGDPGLANVTVAVPDGYEVELLGADATGDDAFEEIDGDGITTYTAAAIADPVLWDSSLVARDDDQLRAVPVEVDGHDVRILAWPDDVEWSDFVAAQITDGLPVLEELIGQPWPVGDELRILETSAPYIYGYAGWYLDVTETIEIGDDLDPDVIFHELGHAWFNEELFPERWINEGLAEEMAARTLERLGNPLRTPEPVLPDDPGLVPLATWGTPSLSIDISDDRERYGYNASFSVIRALVDEIGVEQMAVVIAAAADDLIAYQGDPEAEGTTRPTTWRRFLDLVEELGGPTAATDLFRAHVVDSYGAAELGTRATAREAYAALEAAGGEWTPPLAVREEMAAWRFDTANDAMTEAHGVLELRDDIAEVVEPVGLSVPAELEADYESSDDPADVALDAADLFDAAEAIAAAHEATSADHGLIASIGLLGGDADDALDEAEREFADGDAGDAEDAAERAIDLVDGATTAGWWRLAATFGVVLVLAGSGYAVRRTLVRRRRPSDPGPDSDDPQAPAAELTPEYAALDPESMGR